MRPSWTKQGEELNHWIAFAENFSYSPKQFYEEVRDKLADRKIPDITLNLIPLDEAGLLSDRRIYLRIQRERLLFDICAAPFGTGFFFSCRTVRLPTVVGGLHVLVLLLALGGIYYGLTQKFNFVISGALTLFLVLLFSVILRNAATEQSMSFDDLLTRIPVLGTIYEAWFRKDTYYRTDTRLMYLDLIPTVVRQHAEVVTGAKGVKLLRQYQLAPVLGDLYKPLVPREP